METYLTLCYLIKWIDIGILRDIMKEITIILQAPSAKKPKYTREMLRQMHILDIITANLVLKNAYIATVLVKLQDLPYTFYKINLLLEYYNKEFK